MDNKCRIKLDDGSTLTKCFACGVGFPVRTKDGVAGVRGEPTNPRADSFSLYMNTVGEVLLKNIMPRKRLMMATQREYPVHALELAKSLQMSKKKKTKDLMGLAVQSLLNQPVLQPRQDDGRVKTLPTQKHPPQKLHMPNPPTMHLSPKLKEKAIMKRQNPTPDEVGEGLRNPTDGSEQNYGTFDGLIQKKVLVK